MTILFNFSAKKSCKEEFKMENPKILIIKQSRRYPSSISGKEEVERVPFLLMTIDLFLPQGTIALLLWLPCLEKSSVLQLK